MEYLATGLMSGTSLDGLDIAWCRFRCEQGRWHHEILQAETIAYPAPWEKNLSMAHQLPSEELLSLHFSYGRFIGEQLLDFFSRHRISDPGIIACHGHTVFHRPEAGYTFQLGHGAAIAARVSGKVISDFRSLDVALNGQGAPLVPIGDELLFGKFDYCLNLGGFANISFRQDQKRVAFDICPVNFVINQLVRNEYMNRPEQPAPLHEVPAFDRDGMLARMGSVDENLLKALNSLPFYTLHGPKSLGAEWVEDNIWPLFKKSEAVFCDQLRTYYDHVAKQINAVFLHDIQKPERERKVLVTGGGCYNLFLMERIRQQAPGRIEYFIPDNLTIDYKEALVFAFLGVLRIREEVNCLSSSTGSLRDNTGGSTVTGSPAD